jgi:hypothetical protein
MTAKQAPPPWDKMNSSYWWIIKLDGSHVQNTPQGRAMTGYSKRQGHDEAKDKVQLVMSKTLMLATQGYTARSEQIEMYIRTGEFINKSSDPLMFTLYKKDFRLESGMLKPKWEPVCIFLDKLYTAIRTGQPINNLLPKKKIDWSKEDFFDLNKLFFTDVHQLDNYCRKLAKNDHPFDRIIKFREDYIDKKPFLLNEKIQNQNQAR